MVQVAEHAYLSEFSHTCQENEFQIRVCTFQYTVKRLQNGTIFLLQRFVVYALQQRFVIFVHKNHDGGACGIIDFFYQICKPFFRFSLVFFSSILFLPFLQMLVQYGKQRLLVFIVSCVQINMQNRIYLPFIFRFFDIKSLKKFTLTLEICFQCRNKQTLPETARTTEELYANLIQSC